MLGTLQSFTTRIEVGAKAETLQRCLSHPDLLRQWMWPTPLMTNLPAVLEEGSEFKSPIGPWFLHYRVAFLSCNRLQLILWGAADGFCEWSWGNHWVQLRVEAMSLLPMSLGQFLNLRQLQHYAAEMEEASSADQATT
jgi:hypothetical protein